MLCGWHIRHFLFEDTISMPRTPSGQVNHQPQQRELDSPLVMEKIPSVWRTAEQTTIPLHRYAERLQVFHDIHSAILTAQSPELVA
jgi:hypothetical protein